MKLPGAEQAVIGREKIRDYLLSASHPIGRFKAAFFRSLGYSTADWRRLEIDLGRLASAGDATRGQQSAYGTKYEVRGMLGIDPRREAEVVTVWIVLADEVVPRFLTRFPEGAHELQDVGCRRPEKRPP